MVRAIKKPPFVTNKGVAQKSFPNNKVASINKVSSLGTNVNTVSSKMPKTKFSMMRSVDSDCLLTFGSLVILQILAFNENSSLQDMLLVIFVG